MTHAHITEQNAKHLINQLEDLSYAIDEIHANDEAQDILYGLIAIFRHEIERMTE